MIDIKHIRENKEMVKENIIKKFQDEKLNLVDEVYELDVDYRKTKVEADNLRSSRNNLSGNIGELVRAGKTDEVESIKKQVQKINEDIINLEKKELELEEKIYNIMAVIPNFIDKTVPIGKTDEQNVQRETFGEPKKYNFEVPHHTEILEAVCGLDLDSARKTSGTGFYYLTGDIARLHSAILSYARDFMIDKGFTYCIPPFMIRSDVVKGVMSFDEMENMMYKIENEDLYLIGTSEHSMIGRYIDSIIKEEDLPILLTSYSPCFRKEVGAHGIDERGIYRVHQFEKQEMVVICKPEESLEWYDKMLNYSIEFFKTLDIPFRSIECCSGDLADLKVKSADLEAWTPRQNKYFGELGSCSTLGDAQSRRLKIRVDNGKDKYFAHTLNNTVVAPPRMLIAFIENNLNEDLSINIPEVLRPYMGGKEKISSAK